MSENQGGYYPPGDAGNEQYQPTASYPQPSVPMPPMPPVPQQQPGYAPGYGQPQPPGAYYGAPPQPALKTSGMAVTGMVMGIIGLVFFWAGWFGIIINVLALIFSGVGMSQTNRPGVGGKGMAIAGLVCSLIGIGLFILILAFVASVANSL